jgi:hypothetical protein
MRRTNLEDQPPGTWYDSLDFWPFDATTNRQGAAIRPGYSTTSGLSNVNLIASLNVAPADTYSRQLFTASGGNLYKWTGTSTSNVGNGITTGSNVQAAAYLQDLFIANGATQKVYTTGGGTVIDWTATDAGTVPPDCRLICEWADRIVLAGDPNNPHEWFMSRIGDPYKWLYAADDEESPVAATDTSDGHISEPITSLIPHNRDCIIFGTAQGMAVMRGNPVAGGALERISFTTGPVNGTAWCKASDEWTYMLTRDGLYKMPPGCGANPLPVSNERIPNSLKGIDGVSTKAFLAYDVVFRCIHIYLSGSISEAWHYFPQYEAFCPATVPYSSILAIGRYDPLETSDKSGVIIGNPGATVRLDRTAALGNTAYLKILFKLTESLSEKAIIQRAMLKFSANSDDSNATLDLYGGDGADSAAAAPAMRKSRLKLSSVNDVTNHRMYAWHPRVGGSAAMLVITNSDTSKHIAYEDGYLDLELEGDVRR